MLVELPASGSSTGEDEMLGVVAIVGGRDLRDLKMDFFIGS